jgi:hypothetical protein
LSLYDRQVATPRDRTTGAGDDAAFFLAAPIADRARRPIRKNAVDHESGDVKAGALERGEGVLGLRE